MNKDFELEEYKKAETKLMDTILRCENREIRQVWFAKFNWLENNYNKYVNYLRLKCRNNQKKNRIYQR